MILEIVENHNSSRDIEEATVQALEREEKIKACKLGVMIDTKVSSSVKKIMARPGFK